LQKSRSDPRACAAIASSAELDAAIDVASNKLRSGFKR
jgi:hypothetical protein